MSLGSDKEPKPDDDYYEDIANKKNKRKIMDIKFGNKLQQIARIYNHKDYGKFQTFSTQISAKNKDDDWENVFLNCIYNGNIDLKDKEEYRLEGFLSVKPAYKDYKADIKFIVQKASKKSNEPKEKNKRENNESDESAGW